MQLHGFGFLRRALFEPVEPTSTAPDAERLRLAIVSTPRSGNTWFRHMIANLYGLDELARHRPREVPWNDLTDRCVLQIHWHHVEPFVSQLAERSFRVVVLARHPLDMLLSQLNWVNSCPFPASIWSDNPALDGDRGTEVPLIGASPMSRAFVNWACSPRAAALLSVSLQWSSVPGVFTLRYEDLVRSAASELERVVTWLGWAPRRTTADVAGTFTFAGSRRMGLDASQHYWQGQPGLWKRLLPPAEARRIAGHHARSFERFSYVCDPDGSLTHDQAAANWRRLTEQKSGESS